MNESSEGPVIGWRPLNVETAKGFPSGSGVKEGDFSSNKEDDEGTLSAEATIIGLGEQPRCERSQESGLLNLEILNANSAGIAIRRMGEADLANCQDCFGVRASEKERIVVVADGVGSGLCSGAAAEIVSRNLAKNPDLILPDGITEVIKEEQARELVGQMGLGGLIGLEEMLDKYRKTGSWGSTTMAEVVIEENQQLRFRKIGDCGIVVVRPGKQGKAELLFEKFSEAKGAPAQLACTTEGSWELRGGEMENGEITVKKNDVVLVFTDGFLKQEGFKNKKENEITEELVSQIGKSWLFTTGKVNWPQILAEKLFCGASGVDDTTLAVIVV